MERRLRRAPILYILALAALLMSAPARAAADITGQWQVDVPISQDVVAHWTLALNPDGTYLFSDTTNNATQMGTFRAENGRWSVVGMWAKSPYVAPGTIYKDSGSYRLIGEDQMRLTGNYGSAVWRRITP